VTNYDVEIGDYPAKIASRISSAK